MSYLDPIISEDGSPRPIFFEVVTYRPFSYGPFKNF
ncbi:MAG: hypothetical protein HeimC3_49790 [Candidatus Heimdallarchaeota archaeon LC_3]|nr:MAG: hypothetical protein HeimC3_49790 [Candidatus Heimdallarchaeota archaeon LC_3]